VFRELALLEFLDQDAPIVKPNYTELAQHVRGRGSTDVVIVGNPAVEGDAKGIAPDLDPNGLLCGVLWGVDFINLAIAFAEVMGKRPGADIAYEGYCFSTA